MDFPLFQSPGKDRCGHAALRLSSPENHVGGVASHDLGHLVKAKKCTHRLPRYSAFALPDAITTPPRCCTPSPTGTSESDSGYSSLHDGAFSPPRPRSAFPGRSALGPNLRHAPPLQDPVHPSGTAQASLRPSRPQTPRAASRAQTPIYRVQSPTRVPPSISRHQSPAFGRSRPLGSATIDQVFQQLWRTPDSGGSPVDEASGSRIRHNQLGHQSTEPVPPCTSSHYRQSARGNEMHEQQTPLHSDEPSGNSDQDMRQVWPAHTATHRLLTSHPMQSFPGASRVGAIATS